VIRTVVAMPAKIPEQTIHVISPNPDLSRLTLECRAALLARALPFLARFVDLTQTAGAVPTVENMPPVLRMRRNDFAFTPIGMASEDLRWLVERLPGLRLLPDTSHTGLYLNARRLEPDPQYAWSAPLNHYLKALPEEAPDLVGYMQSLEPHVENAQVSNASGVLGEGLIDVGILKGSGDENCESKAFRGINFTDLQTAYRQFCKDEKVAQPAVDLGDVIDFYNKAAANLPDHTKLQGMKLPGASVVLDRKGERFADYHQKGLPYLDGFTGIYADKQAVRVDAIRADRAAIAPRRPTAAVSQARRRTARAGGCRARPAGARGWSGPRCSTPRCCSASARW